MSDQTSKSRILFVEDNEYIGYMYQRALNEAGFDTALTSDVKEGLEIAAEEKPDLILLDLVLPHNDGFWMLKAAKESSFLKGTPIFVFTNLSSETDKAEALRLGASDYLLKIDYTPSLLIKRIKQFLNIQ
jgi:DNA-binding response OmpR family regulator